MENFKATSKYAFVIAASENYLPSLIALLNSLEYWNNKQDVLLLSFRLPEEFLNKLDQYKYKIHIIKSENDDQVKGTAIDRFKIVYVYGVHYEAICLMDSDMFLTANVNLFFRIAAKGFIIAGSNGMIINFNKDYQKKYNVDLEQDQVIYPKVHTTAPIFLSKEDFDWFIKLYNSRRVDSFDDFLYLNILGIKMGKDKKMLVLSPFFFTGIHHWQLKPETAVMDKGIILSGTEEQVYMSHGKWFDKAWYDDLMLVMNKYIKDENYSERQTQRVLQARKTLLKQFYKYYREIPIQGEMINWIEIELK